MGQIVTDESRPLVSDGPIVKMLIQRLDRIDSQLKTLTTAKEKL